MILLLKYPKDRRLRVSRQKPVRTISTCFIVIESLSIHLGVLRYPEVCKEGLIYETLHSRLRNTAKIDSKNEQSIVVPLSLIINFIKTLKLIWDCVGLRGTKFHPQNITLLL